MESKSRFDINKYNSPLAKRIRYLMDINGVTRKDLAHKLGVSEPAISQYQAGKNAPSIDTLIKIASVFNTSTDYLLGLTNDLNIQYSVIDDTGLTNDSVNTLKRLKTLHEKGYYQLSLINSILSYPKLDELLDDAETYFSSVQAKELFKYYHDAIVKVSDKVDGEFSFMDLCFYLEHRVPLDDYPNKDDLELDENSSQYLEEAKQYYQVMFAILHSKHYNPLTSRSMLELFNSPQPHESKLDYIYALKVLESLKGLKDHILQEHSQYIKDTLIKPEELEGTSTMLIDW